MEKITNAAPLEEPPQKDIEYSAELNRQIEELLLSCDRVGEGGKAVVLRLAADHVPPELKSAFEALNPEQGTHETPEDASPDKAIKLYKLYLPNKGAFEYKMHGKAYDALQNVPEEQQSSYARIPALSSARSINFDKDAKQKLAERFSIPAMGDKVQLISMEYVDGEDLATIFYKWILEREGLPADQTDAMDFKQLYAELALTLGLEAMPEENEIDDELVWRLAEWKNSAKNAEKIYAYLRKNKFPMPPEVISRVQNTLELLHRSKITHCDAFERNIMVTGGMRTLREKGSLEGETPYVIDFGEAREGAVEGVDDFNVIRRMEKLLMSPEEERRIEQKLKFDEINNKAELLRSSKKWEQTYGEIKTLAEAGVDKALAIAWSRTAGFKETATEDFFIIAQSLEQDGILQNAELGTFIKMKTADKMTPFQANRIRECMQWMRP